MKKLIGLFVILATALVVWVAYSSHVGRIREGLQGDPVRAVNTVMNASVRISGLLWDEQQRDMMRSELQKWQEAAEEGGKTEVPQSFKRYGIEDPSRVFRDEDFGKATVSAMCLYQFDSFTVEPASIGPDTATIRVTFLPVDILGMKRLVTKLGAPQAETKPKPVSVTFSLEKRWHRWYIADVGGTLAQFIKAAHRLRRLD